MKCLEENIGVNNYDFGLDHAFLNRTVKSISIQRKIVFCQNLKLVWFIGHCEESEKTTQNGRKPLQILFLIRIQCPEYIENAKNSTIKKTQVFKMGIWFE